MLGLPPAEEVTSARVLGLPPAEEVAAARVLGLPSAEEVDSLPPASGASSFVLQICFFDPFRGQGRRKHGNVLIDHQNSHGAVREQ